KRPNGADCKFAGFTPSVVRIHSYPRLLQRHSSSSEPAWRVTHSTQSLRTSAFWASQRRCEQCQYGSKDRRAPSTESRQYGMLKGWPKDLRSAGGAPNYASCTVCFSRLWVRTNSLEKRAKATYAEYQHQKASASP